MSYGKKEFKQLIIKPLKEQWIMWVITFYLAFIVVLIIGVIVSLNISEKIPWKGIGYFFFIYSIIILLCAIISRIAYRGKLIITEDKIIKKYGKKDQFQIKKEDLLFIGVRKVNVFVKLLIILSVVIGDMCTDVVSFRFYNADTTEIRKFGGYLKMSSLTEEEIKKGMKEFVECISYRQALKIGKLLNVPVINVVF